MKTLIATRARDSQRRIASAAATLRHMVDEASEKEDIELAITLVLAELASRDKGH